VHNGRMSQPPRPIVRELAVHASVDTRTATRAVAEGSRSVRGLAGVRLARSMLALGIRDPDSALGSGCNDERGS
jgi:hypothetical protein